jgi:hypothetical protein
MATGRFRPARRSRWDRTRLRYPRDCFPSSLVALKKAPDSDTSSGVTVNCALVHSLSNTSTFGSLRLAPRRDRQRWSMLAAITNFAILAFSYCSVTDTPQSGSAKTMPIWGCIGCGETRMRGGTRLSDSSAGIGLTVWHLPCFRGRVRKNGKWCGVCLRLGRHQKGRNNDGN